MLGLSGKSRAAAAFGFALLMVPLAIAATWPVSSAPAELAPASLANNDYWFNAWVVHWGAHALLERPLDLHHANIFWPESHTFAYSDIELGHSLLVLPWIAAGANVFLVMNVLTLLAMVIGGTGAFLLGRRVTGSALCGAVTGLVFVFNDAHFARRLAVQFFGDHWLPWLALATLVWLERRTARSALVAGALFVLHATTGSHNAVFGALLVAVLAAVHLVRARLWADSGWWRSVATFALLPVLVLVPLFYPYLLVQERMAGERGANPEVLAAGSARPIDLLSGASRLHAEIDDRWGWPSDALGAEPGAHLFPGWVPLLLAVIGVGAARRPRTPGAEPVPRPGAAPVWWLLAGVCLWLALGPAAGLYEAVRMLPGLQLIRVPSRFVLPGLLALAVLAGVGAGVLARRRRGALWVVLALLAFAAESVYAPVEWTTFDIEPGPAIEWIAARPGRFAILEVPVDADNLASHARQTLYSVHHFQRLLVGYSGWRSPEVTRRLRRIERRFPARAVLGELSELGVRYVIAREERLPEPRLRRMRRERRLTEVFRSGTVSVWELTPPDGSRSGVANGLEDRPAPHLTPVPEAQ